MQTNNHQETTTSQLARFLAKLNHRLRTPINSILGFADLIKEDLTDGNIEGAEEDLKNIDKAGEQVLAILKNLSLYGKLLGNEISSNPKEIDVETFIDFLAQTRKEFIFSLENDIDRSCLLKIDFDQTNEILTHIILGIHGFVKTNDPIQIHISANKKTQDLKIVLLTNPLDISTETLNTMLDPLNKKDNLSGDIGTLDLALIHPLCNLIGAEFSIQYLDSKRAEFSISLPYFHPPS